ncbi:MAG: hypothetical protein N2111_02355 [Candidatus Sumerlaeaceae bacterium]|nr:hypothetical protein [Candidatus Sumerlaeaceae bacterium]
MKTLFLSYRLAVVVLAAALFLAGCGAEPPQPPAPQAEGAGRPLNISQPAAETTATDGASSQPVTR